MTEPLGTPDDDLDYAAWELHALQGLSVRQVAARLGIPKSTAGDRIKRGRVAAEVAALLDRGERRQDVAGQLADLYAIVRERVEKADDPIPYVDRLLKIQKAHRELAGLDAAVKFQISRGNDEERPRPDPRVAEAVRRWAERNRRDEEALRAGRPGVIETGE